MPTTYPNFNEILQVPGFLYWNPTGFTTENQYGTLLGYTESGVQFRPNISVIPVRTEERGAEPSLVIYTGASPVLTVVLQNYNNTMISRLFPGMLGTNAINYPGSFFPGTDLANTSTHYKPLLFMPVNETDHFCLLFQKAVPSLVETAQLNLQHDKRVFFTGVFRAIRKTSHADGSFYMGNKTGAVLR